MVPILSLWLPILLSAVFVFLVSSVIHMVLPYHRSDFSRFPNEDAVIAALRPLAIPPGDYVVPHLTTMKDMQTPAYQEKVTKGPVGFMTVFPNVVPTMGRSLTLWFLYCLVVGVFAAYLAGRTLMAGAPYLEVFRIVGTVAFLGYALALWQNTIWYRRKASTTLKSMFDGLIYACVTAGTFGWLWP